MSMQIPLVALIRRNPCPISFVAGQMAISRLLALRDRDAAIVILDEIGDATEAELFETNDLFVNFTLTDQGHLEFENFSESFDTDIAAVLAAEMNASMITIWDDVKETTVEPIGSYWRWLAQEARRLSLATEIRPN